MFYRGGEDEKNLVESSSRHFHTLFFALSNTGRIENLYLLHTYSYIHRYITRYFDIYNVTYKLCYIHP